MGLSGASAASLRGGRRAGAEKCALIRRVAACANRRLDCRPVSTETGEGGGRVAIYHFSAKVIGRSTGRSAVAAAAYRAAERLHDERLGRDHDFTAKAGVVHSEVLLPEGAPERWRDRATLWNEVEAGERQKNSQLARDVEIALPRELSKAEAVALARDFVREQFVTRGMVADLNVHWTTAGDGQAQPHAHVMLSMRAIDGDGFGKKERGWNDRELLCGWRERWAELANKRLAELDHDVRIDHRSYAVLSAIKDELFHSTPEQAADPLSVSVSVSCYLLP